jgi:glycosyltransferase involved in cell wall biosynthesis
VPHPIYENFGNVMPVAEARKRLDLMNERVILFFGYIRAYKGLDLLLEAMPRIVSEIPLTLLVVGEFYEGAGRYEKLIKEGGIETSVRLVGTYVPNEEVSLYFSACDVVVLPYRSATQSGIVQIAYQFDRPVIATDVGGLSEVVLHQKTGIIVPPGDPTALSAAVIEFYRSNLGPRFADQVRKEKAKYTWEALVEALESTLPKAGEEQTKR